MFSYCEKTILLFEIKWARTYDAIMTGPSEENEMITPEEIRKVAVVTGAGSGIGREVARQMLADGYRVALAGRREAQLNETAGGHLDALVVPCDVTRPDDVERLFEAAREQWGRVDVLFNNAGVFGPAASVDEISLDDWNATVAVNLTGSMLCAAAAVRTMKAQEPQGGRIINNGSISATAPRPNSAPYTATKHAITGLTKATSLDGRKYDIACGQIDIGNAVTGMAARMATGVKQADGRIAAEAMLDVERVADAVVHMAGLPLEANVPFMTIMATKMPFVGRG